MPRNRYLDILVGFWILHGPPVKQALVDSGPLNVQQVDALVVSEHLQAGVREEHPHLRRHDVTAHLASIARSVDARTARQAAPPDGNPTVELESRPRKPE